MGSPRRMLLASFMLLVGSVCLLAALHWYEPSWEENDNEDDDNNEEQKETTTNTVQIIANVLVLVVLALAVLALPFQWLTMRALDRRQLEDRDYQQQEQQQQGTFSSFAQRLLFNHSESSSPRRSSRTTKVSQFHHHHHDHLTAWDELYRRMLLGPSVGLFLFLILRLFAGADTFHGVPQNLDFGWKYGIDIDGVYENEPAEKNVAFTPEFNSLGHALQGFVASLLSFPLVMRLLLPSPFSLNGSERSCSTYLRIVWKNIVHLVPWTMTLYPSYNLVKRWLKTSAAFAGSSFCSNGLEWAGGFVIGLAVGQLATAVHVWWRLVKNPKQEGGIANMIEAGYYEESELRRGRASPNDSSKEPTALQPSACIRLLQGLLGCLLLLTLYAGAVLSGLTWYTCLEESQDECVNFSNDDQDVPIGILTAFVAVPAISYIFFI